MEPRKSKTTVFLVDDDLGILEVVKETISELKVHVLCFSRAEECVKQLRTEKCQLLITDINMPGMDGIELLTEAKCKRRLKIAAGGGAD